MSGGPVFHQDKEELIAAMDRELEKIPGALWNFSQPIADNMEEAVSGVKGELAIKIYGDDLRTLEAEGRRDRRRDAHRFPASRISGLFRVIGQPNLNSSWTATQAARYGINVADVQDAIETAVGGKAVSQVLQGEQRYDLVVRYQPAYREHQGSDREDPPAGARRRARLAGAALQCHGARRRVRDLSRGQLALHRHQVQRARARPGQHGGRGHAARCNTKVKLPTATTSTGPANTRARNGRQKRLAIVVPHHDAGDLHDPLHDVRVVQMGAADPGERRDGADRRPAGAAAHGHAFSVSSGVGFLALFGVSVQTGVIMLEYINQLRARGQTIVDAAVEGRGAAPAARS